VERLKRVEAEIAAIRGAAATAREEAAQLRSQAVYGVASRSGMVGDRLNRMCAPGRDGLIRIPALFMCRCSLCTGDNHVRIEPARVSAYQASEGEAWYKGGSPVIPRYADSTVFTSDLERIGSEGIVSSKGNWSVVFKFG
jgi:hypothetical protein